MCTHAGRAGMRMERKDAEWGGRIVGWHYFLISWLSSSMAAAGRNARLQHPENELAGLYYVWNCQSDLFTYLLIYSRSFPLTLTPAVSVLPHFQGKYHTFYSAALIHPPKCMLYKSGFTYKACGEIIKYNPSTKQCIQFELTKYQFGPHPLIFWSLEPIPDDSEQEAGSTLDRLPINHKERRQHLG